MNKLKKFLTDHPIIPQIFLYGIIGGTSSAIDMICYTLLSRFTPIHDLLANFIGINIGIAISFLLNTYFNFKKTDSIKKRAISFFSVGYLGLLLSMLIMFLGVEVANINDLIVKLCSIVIVAAFQFVLNKLITFGKIGSNKKSN